jgi:hypothetical protein
MAEKGRVGLTTPDAYMCTILCSDRDFSLLRSLHSIPDALALSGLPQQRNGISFVSFVSDCGATSAVGGSANALESMC